jgi:hypothetical protein
MKLWFCCTQAGVIGRGYQTSLEAELHAKRFNENNDAKISIIQELDLNDQDLLFALYSTNGDYHHDTWLFLITRAINGDDVGIRCEQLRYKFMSKKENIVSIPKEDLPKSGSKVIKDMIKRGGSGAGKMRGKNNRRPKDKKNDPTKVKE